MGGVSWITPGSAARASIPWRKSTSSLPEPDNLYRPRTRSVTGAGELDPRRAAIRDRLVVALGGATGEQADAELLEVGAAYLEGAVTSGRWGRLRESERRARAKRAIALVKGR